MNIVLSWPLTNELGTDGTVSCDRAAELVVHHKKQSLDRAEGGLSIGIKASRKIIEQLLNELEMYRECVTEADGQLRRKMKSTMGTERQEDVEIYATAIILAYNKMVSTIFSRTHKLKMELNDDLSFLMQYSKIIENAIQSSIVVTNQLLDFSLLLRP